MNGSSKRSLAAEVRRFRTRFAQAVGTTLDEVIPAGLLKQWVVEEGGRWRNRIYGPLVTLKLFLEQVLSADQSCQDAVARGLSERVALDQAPCSVNSASYCEARKRLPLGLSVRLAKEVGARLCTGQPSAWRWRGREVKFVLYLQEALHPCNPGWWMAPPCRCPTCQRTRSVFRKAVSRSQGWVSP